MLNKIVFSVLMLSSVAAFAAEHSQPVPFDQLPSECQSYFQRTDACFAKASNSVAIEPAKNVVHFLIQALPAATKTQRTEMCKVANRDFAARVKSANCE